MWVWRCKSCGKVYEREPFVCDCGGCDFDPEEMRDG